MGTQFVEYLPVYGLFSISSHISLRYSSCSKLTQYDYIERGAYTHYIALPSGQFETILHWYITRFPLQQYKLIL